MVIGSQTWRKSNKVCVRGGSRRISPGGMLWSSSKYHTTLFKVLYHLFKVPYHLFKVPYHIFKVPYHLLKAPHHLFKVPYHPLQSTTSSKYHTTSSKFHTTLFVHHCCFIPVVFFSIHPIQEFLQELGSQWEHTLFELADYKSRCFLVRNWELLMSSLTSQLSDLHSMSQSPFFKVFVMESIHCLMYY